MGIKGLKSFLDGKGSIQECSIASGSTLVIDGDGWMFHFIKHCRGQLYMDSGGFYGDYASIISTEIHKLQSYGLKLVVLFDGQKNPMKEGTTNGRLHQREEEWNLLQRFCVEQDSICNQNGFPLAPLCKEQFLATLDKCSVRHLRCTYEADQEIALLVQQQNLLWTPVTMCFAFALDSDFIVMKDCPYIEFGDIEFDAEGRLCATVWDRAFVCRTFNVSEAQFLDFVMFLGNDYTAPLIMHTDLYARMHQVFNGNVRLIMQDWFRKVSKQQRAILRAVDLFRPLPPLSPQREHESRMQYISQLQFTMDYSHAFYNLEPLDIFYEQARLTLPPAVPYSSASCVFDFHHYGEASEGKFFADLGRYVKAAEKMGTEGVDRGVAVHALTYLKRKCAGSAIPTSTGAVVTDEHRTAIQAMLKILQQRSTVGGIAPLPDHSELRPNWADVLAAYVYQKTCALMLKSFPVGAFVGEHNAPVMLFDGKLFHTTLRDFRDAKADVPASPTLASSPVVQLTFDFVVPPTNASLSGAMDVKDANISSNDTHTMELSVPTAHPSKTEVLVHNIVSPAPVIGVSPPETPITRLEPISNVVLSTSVPVFVTVPRYQAPRGVGPPPMLSNAERKAERKAHRKAEQFSRPLVVRSDVSSVLDVAPPPVACNPFETLPIDEHRRTILRHIQSHRVTIIHGETGCGKSSRLPQFLLEDAETLRRHCHIFVAQPRRIGVIGMLKRLRPAMGNKVGMRMGHGVRDETAETKLHYVTTGYLVQLLAHNPEALRRCTHIVIDEVHERSVDGDLICLLVRDLLWKNTQQRVILMSATANTDLYQDYFSQSDYGFFGSIECLSVGVKRFPVETIFLDDLLKASGPSDGRKAGVRQLALKVLEIKPLAQSWVEAQYSLVLALLRSVCRTGSTVLVFISGMDDITNIAALLEPYPQFLVCPLHSTTPEEEQDLAFETTPPGNVKVVLATNMAESSVTIPDCDVVICLGTHKAVSFSDSLQRTHVAFGFISKASATQRAGRTGRVRPGTVYRLYTKDTYQRMKEHELAEVLRRPLEDVVLNMWTVLKNAENFQGVTPFLNRLMEAPDVRYIDKSYEKLFEASLITFPSDYGNLTPAGRFVSALPLDLALGRMLSYGVHLGVPAEAVVMAAALSLSRSPYRIASPIFLDPEQYNNQIRKRLLSEDYFNQGDYSEPISLLRMLLEWRALESDKLRYTFCYNHNLQFAVMKEFDGTAVSLARDLERVQKFQCDEVTAVHIDSICRLSARTINTLRLIMTWAFSDNLIKLCTSAKQHKQLKKHKGGLLLNSNRVTVRNMRTFFGDIQHTLVTSSTAAFARYTTSHAIECTLVDPYLRLARLVDSLAKVARLDSAPCFAIVTKSLEVDCSEVVYVVLPGENQHSLIEKFNQCLQNPSSAGSEDLARRLADDCPYIGAASVFANDSVSQLEEDNLYDMLYGVPNSLIMSVPADDFACLCAVKAALNPTFVALIFGVTVYNNNELGKFVMGASTNTTTLSFPPDEKGTSLIQDLPLGHRLVQCCRASRLNLKLVLKLLESEVTEDDHVDIELEGPYKANRAEKCPQLEVDVQSVEPFWRYLYNGSFLPARLSRQSMMSAAFHCGPETLFAVAHTALPVTKLSQTTFMVSGVTFLPTDSVWLQVAMRAIGKDHVCGGLNGKDLMEPPQRWLDLAREIDSAVQDAMEFIPRQDIIDKVNALFAAFTEDQDEIVDRLAAVSLTLPDRKGKEPHANVTPAFDAALSTYQAPTEEASAGSEAVTTMFNSAFICHDGQKPKVVSLPPSVPQYVPTSRLTKKKKKRKKNDGWDQADEYKTAHEIRKITASYSYSTLKNSAATTSGLMVKSPVVAKRAESKTMITKVAKPTSHTISSDEEDDWETNANLFRACHFVPEVRVPVLQQEKSKKLKNKRK